MVFFLGAVFFVAFFAGFLAAIFFFSNVDEGRASPVSHLPLFTDLTLLIGFQREVLPKPASIA